MPRPNPLRSLDSEDNLARRIAYERERRGWTYESTAKRMTDAGCPIQGSAIYKIEKGNPRRRISVDELVAFSTIFDAEISDLLSPVGAAAGIDAMKLMMASEKSLRECVDHADDYHQTVKRLLAHHPLWVISITDDTWAECAEWPASQPA